MLLFPLQGVQSSPALCDAGTVAHQAPLSVGLSRQEPRQAAISFSRGPSRPRDGALVSCGSCGGRRILRRCTAWEAPRVCQSVVTHRWGRRVGRVYVCSEQSWCRRIWVQVVQMDRARRLTLHPYLHISVFTFKVDDLCGPGAKTLGS